MLIVRGVVVKRTALGVTNRTTRVKYFVDDAGNTMVVFHLTNDLSKCYPVSADIVELPVKVKVFRDTWELHLTTKVEDDDKEF